MCRLGLSIQLTLWPDKDQETHGTQETSLQLQGCIIRIQLLGERGPSGETSATICAGDQWYSLPELSPMCLQMTPSFMLLSPSKFTVHQAGLGGDSFFSLSLLILDKQN